MMDEEIKGRLKKKRLAKVYNFHKQNLTNRMFAIILSKRGCNK